MIVAAYGRMLPGRLLDAPEYGCINVHASLLPKFRGSAPIQGAIISGDEKTGVTIMKMDRGMDTGDMIAKAETPTDHKDLGELEAELAVLGGGLLTETLEKMEKGEARFEKQDDSGATYAPMIKKQDGLIDFTDEAEAIERKVRAYRPWPGAFTYRNGEMFKIWDAEVIRSGDVCQNADAANTGAGPRNADAELQNEGGSGIRNGVRSESRDQIRSCEQSADAAPGEVVSISKDGIGIMTGKDILLLRSVQIPGKRRMGAGEFLKGNKIEMHEFLG